MEESKSTLNIEDLDDLKKIISGFLEITKEKLKESKEYSNIFSMFMNEKKGENSTVLLKANTEKVGMMLFDEKKKAKLAKCFDYPTLDKSYDVTLLLSYQELSKLKRVNSVESSMDLVDVLEDCYNACSSVFYRPKVKEASVNFINAALNVLSSRKKNLIETIGMTRYMYEEFSSILKNISAGKKINLKSEDVFYRVLKDHYYMIFDENENKKEDVSSKVKDMINEYNNSISNSIESKNSVFNKEVSKLLRHIKRNGYDKIDYKLFPSLSREDALLILSEVRNRLCEEDVPDLAEKLAVLDMYYASYYKDDDVTSKTKKINK